MTQAIVVATGWSREGLEPLTSLRPVVDRPVLQHVVEQLAARHGVGEIDVLACEQPDRVRALLGDGQRWGVRVRHHLVRDPAALGLPLRRAACMATRPLWLALGDRLVAAEARPDGATVFCHRGPAPEPSWAGLAYLPPRWFEELPAQLDSAALGAWLLQRVGTRGAPRATLAAATDTCGAWLAAQQSVLAAAIPGLLTSGRETAPGVRVGNGSALHPTARLLAPVHVGENVRVGAGAVVGPNAVLAPGSMIEPGARVRQALVLARTYVGDSVDLRGVVAGPGCVLHAALGAAVPVADAFLLGNVARGRSTAVPLRVRVLALTLLVAIAPGLALVAAVLAALGLARRVVRECPQPGGATARPWHWPALARAERPRPGLGDLLDRVAPGRLEVARGRLQMVGVTPRTAEELDRLPQPWAEICRDAPAGLIGEALARLEDDASENEWAAVDAVRAAGLGSSALSLGWTYLQRAFHRTGMAAAQSESPARP